MPRWRMVIGTLWSMWRMTSRTPWVDGHVWSESFPSWKPIKALLTPSARDPLRSLPPPSLPRLSTLRSDLFITSKNLEKWSSWSEATMSALLHYAQCGKILYFGIAFALDCSVEVFSNLDLMLKSVQVMVRLHIFPIFSFLAKMLSFLQHLFF